MNEQMTDGLALKNVESPFTELFTLMRSEKIRCLSAGLAIDNAKLNIMSQHIENAMNIILQGLQDMGNLMNLASSNKKNLLNDLGLFISAIANLVEALHGFKLDVEEILREREIIND